MRNKILTASVFFMSMGAMACPICDAEQPKGFENITHGTGPEGNWDYVIMGIAVVIVIYTLGMSLKYLIKPKEKSPHHIKYMVVEP